MTDNLTYKKIKEIVADNPGITSDGFYEQLRQKGTDREIFASLEDAISSERHDISEDYAVFLKIVELFAQLDLQVKQSSGGRTMLDIAVTNKQADVVKILLESGKFNEEKKLHALNSAIVQGSVQEVKVLLDFVSHERKLEMLNETIRDQQLDDALRNKRAEVIKILLDKGEFNEKEKIHALSEASIDGNDSIVKLLLEYIDNTEISKASIRSILEIIKESKLSLEKELKIDSQFKVDFDNSDHCKYLSNRVIIALLRSAMNKKEEQNISDAEENNEVRFNNSNGNVSTGQVAVLDSSFVTRLYSSIARTINSVSFESLQQDLNRRKISFQSKCEQGAALETALLEHAIKDKNLKVIELLLENGVTIINTIEEGRYYISKIKENESILSSVVSDTNDNNAEVLRTLLQNINAEQSKLNPESELYRLYQQLKDDAFCTAFEERNSVAATVLIQNDQKRIASHNNTVTGKTKTITQGTEEHSIGPIINNRNVTSKPTATVPPISTNDDNRNHTNEIPKVTTPNVEENKPEPSGNVGYKPTPPTPTEETDVGSTAESSSDNKFDDFKNHQFSLPNEKETKYKENKENFHTSLRNDVVGVVITGLFIAAAVMVPSVAGAVICGIVAALALVATGIHVKDSTLPSYKEMREVELTKQSYTRIHSVTR